MVNAIRGGGGKRFAMMLLAAIELVTSPAGAGAQPQSAYISVEDSTAHGGAATGVFSLIISSPGRPFTFDARSLHFFWLAEGSDGELKGTRIPASIRIGIWKKVNLYPSYIDTSPDRNVDRKYQAQLDFGASPGSPGRYELAVDADPRFAHTDQGVPLAVRNSTVTEVYWPDERNADAASADLRRRILGRTVYAFGGSLLVCAGSHKAEPFTTPLRVTRVSRRVEGAYWLETGATGRAYATSFVAVHPIEVNVDGCDPGFRFADPWQAGVSITTQPPPPSLRGNDTVVTRMSRNTVLWLLGYPNEYGTAQYFNTLEQWNYTWPQGLFKSVRFKNDRVTNYATQRG